MLQSPLFLLSLFFCCSMMCTPYSVHVQYNQSILVFIPRCRRIIARQQGSVIYPLPPLFASRINSQSSWPVLLCCNTDFLSSEKNLHGSLVLPVRSPDLNQGTASTSPDKELNKLVSLSQPSLYSLLHLSSRLTGFCHSFNLHREPWFFALGVLVIG